MPVPPPSNHYFRDVRDDVRRSPESVPRLRDEMDAVIVAQSGLYLESLPVVGADAIHT